MRSIKRTQSIVHINTLHQQAQKINTGSSSVWLKTTVSLDPRARIDCIEDTVERKFTPTKDDNDTKNGNVEGARINNTNACREQHGEEEGGRRK